MSIQQLELEARCQAVDSCDAIELVIHPKPKDLGGFTVNRCLPVMEKRSVGPWIFLMRWGRQSSRQGQALMFGLILM